MRKECIHVNQSQNMIQIVFQQDPCLNLSHFLNYDKLFIQKISFILMKFNDNIIFELSLWSNEKIG
jgi:hypothetical protein